MAVTLLVYPDLFLTCITPRQVGAWDLVQADLLKCVCVGAVAGGGLLEFRQELAQEKRRAQTSKTGGVAEREQRLWNQEAEPERFSEKVRAVGPL